MKICVLGAGTWGTALASLLVENGHNVVLWSAIGKEIDELKSRRSHKNLPGALLPDGLEYTKDIAEACVGKELVLIVVPSEYMRSTVRLAAPYVEPKAIVVSAAKGIEANTLMFMTDIISDEMDKRSAKLP